MLCYDQSTLPAHNPKNTCKHYPWNNKMNCLSEADSQEFFPYAHSHLNSDLSFYSICPHGTMANNPPRKGIPQHTTYHTHMQTAHKHTHHIQTYHIHTSHTHYTNSHICTHNIHIYVHTQKHTHLHIYAYTTHMWPSLFK